MCDVHRGIDISGLESSPVRKILYPGLDEGPWFYLLTLNESLRLSQDNLPEFGRTRVHAEIKDSTSTQLTCVPMTTDSGLTR